MLKRARGDLVQMAVEGQFDVLVHGCNCFKTMGAGIAKQIADKWPEALISDKAFHALPPERLGEYTTAYIENESGDPLVIINAYTQYTPGKQGEDVFSYTAFDHILKQLRVHFPPSARIAFPYIGMGLAGGDPKQIIPMLEDFATTHDVTLVSYSDKKKRRDRVAAFNAHYNRRS